MTATARAVDTHRDLQAEARVTVRDHACVGDLSDYLKRAMQRTGATPKDLQFWWGGVNHAYVSRVLSNQDPLTDRRFAELPVWLQFATFKEWARDRGITVGRKADLQKAIEAIAKLAAEDTHDPRLDAVKPRALKAGL